MTNMRTLINLVEDFGGASLGAARSTDQSVNRIWNNARVLQSEIKYLNAAPAVLSRLKASFDVVMGYLDELHGTN